jgi:predicted dehydrogenase
MVKKFSNLSGSILKVGVIGLGRQALNDHIPALLRRKDVVITCVSDINTSAHNAFFEMYPALKGKVNAYQDFNDVIKQGVDFAIVAIPHDQYFEVSKTLCKNKIPFMKEKPFARTLDETIALASIEDIASYCFICTQRRFHPLYNEALEVMPELGKIGSFNATYTLNLPLTASGWRKFSDVCGGGVIIDMGYHIIDQLIWWFGYPDDIYAKISNLSTKEDVYDTEDSATIVFSYYKTGLQGSIVLSRCTGIKTEGYQVAGSECFMEGSKSQLLIKDRKSGEILLSKEQAAKEEMMDNQLAYFIDTFTSGRNFERNHLDNLLNMKFIERCYRNKLSKDHALFINA